MKTYPVFTEDHLRCFAFEIENIYVSPAIVAKLLATAEEASDIQLRKMFSNSNEVHINFMYRLQPYVVWEPFGDNSRYWIGPKEGMNSVEDISALETIFKNYTPPFYRSLLGEALTFRFITRFFSWGRST
ncbi:hypothetical protein HA050_21655 [Iodobacter sp. HSC-16F04]|uniref:Uncharacterized protein n=1 Tax=Iodobacter violaceini TaxID=3044271 RepID=A0ABX0L2G6_9NEIS|nr:hypothetical protein [Iodobacter violacea]NHQ88707.1 hypothetical protein [Iodobacter violacea]